MVRRFGRVEEIQSCHILFISESEARHLPKILDNLKGRSILTVSDQDGHVADGVVVQFVTSDNKIRFKINVDSLKQANLVMSSKLLRLAELVPAPPK